MKTQFKITKIDNSIYKIQETWFKEHANLYLFKGKESCLLIDAGIGLFNIKEFLEKKGFKNIKVALTHAHFDHFGGIRHFLPKNILITKKIFKNLKNNSLFGLKFLKQKDLPKKINYQEVKKIFTSFNVPTEPNFIKNIKVGKFNFEIIEMPGHTNDSIIYYDKKNKILITGDVIYDGKIYSNFLNSDKNKLKTSLKNISTLDFTMALPGHNQILNKNKVLKIINKF